MAENIIYLDREGLNEDMSKMKQGLEAFMEAVKTINAGCENAKQHWKGATETEYMVQYEGLKTTLEKDVPNSVNGMIDVIQKFLDSMMEADSSAANRLRG